MMNKARDFDAFQKLMDELNAAFREGFKANDAQLSAYWDALKDTDLAQVRFNVKRLIATATKDASLPRPAALRNSPPVIARPPDPKHEHAERDSIRRWEELRRIDPTSYEILLRSARAARALTSMSEEDPGYQDALYDLRRWDSLRYAPRADQEAAVARFGGRHE